MIKPFKETGQHSYHRRAFNHDYFGPFIYHIILKKQKGFESFGKVVGDAKIPFGNPGCAEIEESAIGRIIAKEIIHFPYEYPIIKILQFKVMPDHVHLLLQVLYRSDKHLEYYIQNLLEKIASKFSRIKNKEINFLEIFEPGFCDKPLYENRSLDGWYIYIKNNPHRLAMKWQYPRFFQKKRNLKIGDQEFEAYGNLFLFKNPDKVSVKMSNKYSEEIREEKIRTYINLASKGTILISPFIHPDEKIIRKKTEDISGKCILIQLEKFSEKYNPPAHEFKQCSGGNLLIISMGYPVGTPLTKKICNEMNTLASLISGL